MGALARLKRGALTRCRGSMADGYATALAPFTFAIVRANASSKAQPFRPASVVARLQRRVALHRPQSYKCKFEGVTLPSGKGCCSLRAFAGERTFTCHGAYTCQFEGAALVSGKSLLVVRFNQRVALLMRHIVVHLRR